MSLKKMCDAHTQMPGDFVFGSIRKSTRIFEPWNGQNVRNSTKPTTREHGRHTRNPPARASCERQINYLKNLPLLTPMKKLGEILVSSIS